MGLSLVKQKILNSVEKSREIQVCFIFCPLHIFCYFPLYYNSKNHLKVNAIAKITLSFKKAQRQLISKNI